MSSLDEADVRSRVFLQLAEIVGLFSDATFAAPFAEVPR